MVFTCRSSDWEAVLLLFDVYASIKKKNEYNALHVPATLSVSHFCPVVVQEVGSGWKRRNAYSQTILRAPGDFIVDVATPLFVIKPKCPTGQH